MEQVVGKLVARSYYLSKKLLEEVQESNAGGIEDNEVDQRLGPCAEDLVKASQLCRTEDSSAACKGVQPLVIAYYTLFLAFGKHIHLLADNPFDFQLRQTVQSSHKELGVQLSRILAYIDPKGSEEKSSPAIESIGTQARKVAMTIKSLAEHASAGDVEKFVPAARQSFTLMKALQDALLLGDEEAQRLGQKLGEYSMNLIRAAKELCQKPSDTSRAEFTNIKQATAQQLQEILFLERRQENGAKETPPATGPGSRRSVVQSATLRNASTIKPVQRKGTDSGLTGSSSETSSLKAASEITPTITEEAPKATEEALATAEGSLNGTNSSDQPPSAEAPARSKAPASSKSELLSGNRVSMTDTRTLKIVKPDKVKDSEEKLKDPEAKVKKSRKFQTAKIRGRDKRISTPSIIPSHTLKEDFAKTLQTELEKRIPSPRGRSATEKGPPPPIPSPRVEAERSTSKASGDLTWGQDEKLDRALALIGQFIPGLGDSWGALGEEHKEVLRDRIEDEFLRSELEAKLTTLESTVNETAPQLVKAIVKFIATQYGCVRALDDAELESRESTLRKNYISVLEALLSIVSESGKGTSGMSVTLKAVEKDLEEKIAAEFALCDPHFVAFATKSGETHHGQLKKILHHTSEGIHDLSVRLLSLVHTISIQGSWLEANLMELMASVATLANATKQWALDYHTARRILEIKRTKGSEGMLEQQNFDELVDIDIWRDPEDAKAGDLNALVRRITVEYDPTFMKTVIYTHHSFTTSSQLFQKLTSRFMIPPTLETARGQAIQLRVGVVLKFWVQNQFSDFDEKMQLALLDFLQVIHRQGHTQMSEGIQGIIDSHWREKAEAGSKLRMRPDHLALPEVMAVPSEYIMQFSPTLVAGQLTLHDSALMANIHPAELMGQAWTNPKTQHRTTNINWCMDRLNMISYWVPTMVLAASSINGRIRLVEWFYALCIELRKLKNYQSLMAVVAGFHTSSVQRLKHTFEGVNKDLHKKHLELEELMSPQSSFKNYRQAMSKSPLPAVPFL